MLTLSASLPFVSRPFPFVPEQFCPAATISGVAEQGSKLGVRPQHGEEASTLGGQAARGERAPGGQEDVPRVGCWKASWLRDAVLRG